MVYVVTSMGNRQPWHICSNKADADSKAGMMKNSEVWEMEVEEPLTAFRVWVRLETEGPAFFIERRLSIPMVFDVFEPMEGGAKMHGSITVEAADEGEATQKAREIMARYMGERVLRTRPIGSTGSNKMPSY